MEIIIYGLGQYGGNAVLAVKKYSQYKIAGIYDSMKKESKDGLQFIDLEKECGSYSDAAVVICMASTKAIHEVYAQLKAWGYNNIYIYLNKTRCYGSDFLRDECIQCGNNMQNELVRAEVHIADHCNLNCKGCTHFSALFDEAYQTLKQCEDDISILKKHVDDIRIMSLMGGEPLLNVHLDEYIEMYRRELPDTILQLVTNGILIPKADGKILECLKKNEVMVCISEYAPTHKMIDRILDRLDQYEIEYSIRKYERKQKFGLPFTINPESSRKKRCLSPGCVNVWNGRISTCPSLMYVHRFNDKFGTALPTDGILDLKTLKQTKSELIDILYKEVPLCAYCVEGEIEWQRCGHNPKAEDFAWND